MTRSRYILQLLITIILLACANGFVRLLAKHSIPRQKIAAIQARTNVRYVASGNSLINSGFDPEAFESSLKPSAGRAVNAGLDGSYPVDHLLLSRLALQAHSDTKQMYYGLFDTQVTDPIAVGFSDIYGTKSIAFLLEPKLAASMYFPNTWIQRQLLMICRFVPMIVDRAQLWAKVELLRRYLYKYSLGSAGDSIDVHADLVSLLVPQNPSEFKERCKRTVESSLPLSPPIMGIIDAARERRIRLLFVLMPVTSGHRQQYYALDEYRRYYQYLTGLLESQRVTLLDATDWVGDDGFRDAIHLNSVGAVMFSKRLAEATCGSDLK